MGGMGGAQPLAGTPGRGRHHGRRRRRDADRAAHRRRLLPASGRRPGRGAGAVPRRAGARRAALGRPRRQCRGDLSRAGAPRHHPRRRDRPDLGARRALRLYPRRAERRRGRGAPRAATRTRCARAPWPRSPRSRGHAGLQEPRRGRVRQRQQHPLAGRRAGRRATPSSIDIFTARYLRPLFSRGIGPFRWLALTGEPDDIAAIDEMVLQMFPDNRMSTNWIALARQHIAFEGLPARICWLGHGERTALAVAVNRAVGEGRLSGPIAFTRDHLDGGGDGPPADRDRGHARRQRRHRRLAAAERPAQLPRRWPTSWRSTPAEAATPAT